MNAVSGSQQQFQLLILSAHLRAFHSNLLYHIILIMNITQHELIFVSNSYCVKYFHLLVPSSIVGKLNESHESSVRYFKAFSAEKERKTHIVDQYEVTGYSHKLSILKPSRHSLKYC